MVQERLTAATVAPSARREGSALQAITVGGVSAGILDLIQDGSVRAACSAGDCSRIVGKKCIARRGWHLRAGNLIALFHCLFGCVNLLRGKSQVDLLAPVSSNMRGFLRCSGTRGHEPDCSAAFSAPSARTLYLARSGSWADCAHDCGRCCLSHIAFVAMGGSHEDDGNEPLWMEGILVGRSS